MFHQKRRVITVSSHRGQLQNPPDMEIFNRKILGKTQENNGTSHKWRFSWEIHGSKQGIFQLAMFARGYIRFDVFHTDHSPSKRVVLLELFYWDAQKKTDSLKQQTLGNRFSFLLYIFLLANWLGSLMQRIPCCYLGIYESNPLEDWPCLPVIDMPKPQN